MDLAKITEILEGLEDEQLAANLLGELNEKMRIMGNLIMNKDPNLDHKVWKEECDMAQKAVADLVKEIENLKS